MSNDYSTRFIAYLDLCRNAVGFESQKNSLISFDIIGFWSVKIE